MTRRLLTLVLLVFCAVLPRTSAAGASEPPPPFWVIAGWGDNTWGQVDPAACCNPKPHPVNGPAGEWAAIAAGERVTVAVRPDGTVWEWGQSDSSSSCTLLCVPGQVPGLHNVTAVATSFLDTRLALASDGTVWQWQSTRQRAPFQVPGLQGIVQIAVGWWYALALDANGTVWEWTYSYDPKADVQPYKVVGLPFIRSIAAGSNHALALSADGAVWTWGAALDLASGNPKPTPPIEVDGLPRISAIAAGDRFSLALDAQGAVWSWGYNIYGELGQGMSGGGSNTPAPVGGLSNVTAISAQAFHAVALRSGGTVWAWGGNQEGQAGNGTVTPYGAGCGCIPAPAEVVGVSGAVAVTAGYNFDLALLSVPLPSATPQLGPCGPPPGPAPAGDRLPLSVPVGAYPSRIAVSERYHRLYLLRPGRYDEAASAYSCTGSLQVLDTRTGRPLATPLVGKNPLDVIVDDPANRVFVVDGGARDDRLHGDIRLFNERTGALVATVAFDGAPTGAALAVHAGHLFVPLSDVPTADTHQAMAVLGTGSGRRIALLPLLLTNDRPVADEATNRVFVHGQDGVTALDASTGVQLGALKQWLCSGALHDDAVDGRIIALIPGASHNGVGSLCIFDPRTLRITGGWDYGPNAGAELTLIDGPAHLLFLQELTYGIGPPPAGFTVRDARTGHLIRQIGGQFVPFAADPANGNVIAIGRQGKTEVLNPRTWKVVKRLSLHAGSLSLTVSRNPHRLIVVSGSEDSAVVTFYAL